MLRSMSGEGRRDRVRHPRPSSTLQRKRCIGAENLRESLCRSDFSTIQGAPRCRQTVRRSCSNLKRLSGVQWWPVSMAGTSPRTQARRCADCFIDRRDPRYVEHQLETLVGQRIFGLALGYEDLNDHDELRKDPTFAVLAGKLSPVLRTDCEPLAGKSTLNRLEHTPRRHASKYHKIDCDGAQVDALLVDLFLEAHERAPREIVLDLDNTDIPLHGMQEGRFFHGYYEEYCVRPEGACHQWREDPSRQMSVWSGS